MEQGLYFRGPKEQVLLGEQAMCGNKEHTNAFLFFRTGEHGNSYLTPLHNLNSVVCKIAVNFHTNLHIPINPHFISENVIWQS